MKWVAKIPLVVCVWLALVPGLRGEPISQLHATDYVNDFAHVLDQNSVAQLDDLCRQIDLKAHAQIAVVTIKSLDGADVESYAVELFKTWGVGGKSSNRGVLILLATEDHRYRIEVGYGLEPILPDGKVGGFGRQAVPFLRQNDYSGAVSQMTGLVAEVIAQDAGVELTNHTRVSEEDRGEPSAGPSAGRIIFLVIVVLIVLLTPLRRLLFWLLLFQGGGGYRGGGWGGGFGGGGGGFGGGGGGFGGFGGGSSGGGGASGSW